MYPGTIREGYAVFSSEWAPTADWDKIQRPWFILTKRAQGKVAYTEPYVDPVPCKLVVAMSKTTFNIAGQKT